MKTAIIYVGQSRTFAKCWKTHNWYVWRRFDNPTFYCCVEDDEQAKDMELIKARFPEAQVHIKRIKTPDSFPIPPELHLDQAPYDSDNHGPQGFAKIMWNWLEAWRWFKESDASQYDLIVKMRPDTYFHDFDRPSRMPYSKEAFGLWWGTYGGFNERIAMFGPEAARAYFTTFERVQNILDAGCPFHGETFVRGSIELEGCTTRRVINAWLSFLRSDGTMVRPDTNWQEGAVGPEELKP